MDEKLTNGSEPDFNFNTSCMSFLVKGDDDHNTVAVLRGPLNTRPLCMKNCDNKIIASANCNALNSDFIKITHRTQNGFTHGRNFLNNLVDVDSASRMYSMWFDYLKSTSLEDIPIAGAFDFEAPFPSVIHEWIWLVLHHRKMPDDYIPFFSKPL